MSQEQLAKLVGISRTGLGAIESHHLAPSVSTALGLARALEMSVESLFRADPPLGEDQWAKEPAKYPARYWCAEVGGRTLHFPAEATPGLFQNWDGAAKRVSDRKSSADLARRTLVVATCDPAIGLLAQMVERHSPFRLIALHRSSRDALEMLRQGFVHAAGVHFARAGENVSNAAFMSDSQSQSDLLLLAVASWEEGIAHSPQLKLQTSKQAAKTSVRWVGRSLGAGARRTQDEVLQGRSAPRQIAPGHYDVASSIRSGFADAGICIRLVAEDAGVDFHPMEEDQYDLCFSASSADDPRVIALSEVVESAEYRKALASLPGYRARRAGEHQLVRQSK